MNKKIAWFSPHWDWLQVEVSSQCHAACVYCPTAIFRKESSNLLMSLETFQKLSASFSQANLVYLQGWGEPFMNPHFFEMVRLVKAAHCRVGMTTNAMLVNEQKLTEIVNSGVDLVTFSLAGGVESNDSFRQGTRMQQVINIIRQLKRIKREQGVTHPEVHIAYMLLRSGLEEIDRLPGLLDGLDISQVVISTLDYVPSPELKHETLIPESLEEYIQIQKRLENLAAAGKKVGVEIRYQLVAYRDVPRDEGSSCEFDLLLNLPVTRPACTENIPRAVFISAAGDVSPCVFTHLPVKSPEMITSSSGNPYQPLVFGNINEQPLGIIWKSKAYRAFRQAHHPGSLNHACQNCLKTRVEIY